MRPYILSEIHFGSFDPSEYSLAVIPWGATEAHNYHLPYGTDNFETEAIAAEAARIVWEQGSKCLVLPNIPFGVNTGQKDIPGTMNLYPSTQAIVLNDLLESIHGMGLRRVVVLNGHGGNDFRQMLREAGSDFADMLLVTANWFQAVDKREIFDENGDHADEMETSLMMVLQPDLVLPPGKAGSGKSSKFKSDVMNESWTWSERKWTKVTADTGIGNPAKATAAKGEKYFRAVCEQVAKLIVALSEMDPQDPYTRERS